MHVAGRACVWEGGGDHRIQAPSDRRVIESIPPLIIIIICNPSYRGVIESGPIPFHLSATPLVMIKIRFKLEEFS